MRGPGPRRRAVAHDDAASTTRSGRPRDVPTGGKKPTKKALDQAVAMIEELSTDWDPESLHRLLPRAARAGDRRASARARRSRLPSPSQGAEAGPGPDGGARADARERQRRPRAARRARRSRRRPLSGQATTSARSLWLETGSPTEYAALDRDMGVDVAVLGGGIAGLTTALLLKRDGVRVAVLEAARVGSGVTGCTTAKVSALQSTIYSTIREPARKRGARRSTPRRASQRSSGSPARARGGHRVRPRAAAGVHLRGRARTRSARSRRRPRRPRRPASTPSSATASTCRSPSPAPSASTTSSSFTRSAMCRGSPPQSRATAPGLRATRAL